MKNKLLTLKAALIVGLLTIFSCTLNNNPLHLADPFVGTGLHGHTYPGAAAPFGMVQLSPDTRNDGWDGVSGYHAEDNTIIGFSHNHLSGTGEGDMGDFLFIPVIGEVAKGDNGFETTPLPFKQSDETAYPGYYSVRIPSNGITAELTATQRTGCHRYTFTGKGERHILVDMAYCIRNKKADQIRFATPTNTSIEGGRHVNGWAKDRWMFFSAEFSVPYTECVPDGHDRYLLTFPADLKELTICVGLSPNDEKGARDNLLAEAPQCDFDEILLSSSENWKEALGKISIEGGDNTDRSLFYTALYHTMVAPSVFSDVCGEYRGADGEVHEGDFTNYTTLSLWDTYRSAHPLQTLIHREKQKDIAQTFLHIFEQQGKLPVWHLMGNETDCMVGNPGVPVLADLVLKGFDIDAKAAFKAMVGSAMLDERSMGLIKQYGYIPYDLEPDKETVAKGLEYALADWCIAQVAQKVGNKEEYEYFLNRSKSYRYYFDPKTRFMRGKDSKGNFRPAAEFDPLSTKHRNDDYCEGNAWQYTWLVPHDVYGLVNLFGSEKAFTAKLDSLFVVEGDLGEEASPDVTGLIGQYAHGNEPSHHIIYMYNYVGQPWKTARLIRQVLHEQYRNDLDGLSGNEDVGQMSAWYVLSSIGLYQEEPAGGKYVIGSPLFNTATLNVGDGKTFTVKAVNNSDENIYIQRATLNGKRYDKSYIDYRDIIAGGTLELVMGPQPSKWGAAKKNRP